MQEKSKEVPMSSENVSQHKRMAAGEKVDGKTLPGGKKEEKKVIKKENK